jgi:hypothetical protein
MSITIEAPNWLIVVIIIFFSGHMINALWDKIIKRKGG